MTAITVFIIVLVFVGIFLYVLNQRPTVHRRLSEKYNDIIDIEPRQHPVLKYQREVSYDTIPASWGDPIRPPSTAGPMGGYAYQKSGGHAYAYNNETGPYVGKPLNVPAPRGALKLSSEYYKYPFYYQKRPLGPYDYFRPYGPNQPEMQNAFEDAA